MATRVPRQSSRIPKVGPSGLDTAKLKFLYIIANSNNEYYVGITSNFDRRLLEHRMGRSKATSKSCTDWRKLLVLEIPHFNELALTEKYLQNDHTAVKIVLREGKVPNDMRLRIMELDDRY